MELTIGTCDDGRPVVYEGGVCDLGGERDPDEAAPADGGGRGRRGHRGRYGLEADAARRPLHVLAQSLQPQRRGRVASNESKGRAGTFI